VLSCAVGVKDIVRRAWIAIAAAVGLSASPAVAAPGAEARGVPETPQERFDTVVIDAGHGGDDEGALGPRGNSEKKLVLGVARRLREVLRDQGLRVVMTREDDRFVPLETRTAIANDARGDLFISIHANATRDPDIRGSETFFLSLDATDEAAQRVAARENAAFGGEGAAGAAAADRVIDLLGDMIANLHSRESSELARMVQDKLALMDPARSRGVKQAPFVVLMGLQMPATLVEIGFITNRADERDLHSERGRDGIVSAVANAVLEFGRRFDARRGVGARVPAKAR
jgi:N-acetylmuramoyl-L-alanine amidase